MAWILIILLILLGGLIAPFGDLLGTKIGKSRFSIFKLRPKKTATIITVITGGIISSISIGLLSLFSADIRQRLFVNIPILQKTLEESKKALIPLQEERKTLEKKIKDKETELTQLERNIFALRSGTVVIRSGQSLFIAEINSSNKENIRSQIEKIIINANRFTHNIVNPTKKETRNLLLIRQNHVDELQNIISKGGDWVINIKSVRNVVSGENFVYAFPEITENKVIVRKGEKITKINFKQENFDRRDFGNKINLLLSSSLAEMKRRGSLSNDIKLRSDSLKELRDFLNKNEKTEFELEAISLRNSKTAQPVIVELNINDSNS